MRWDFWILPSFIMLLAGCSGSDSNSDLDQFMNEIKSQSSGEIEPVPEHESFEVFTYGASGLRSPFEPPRQALEKKKFDKSIKPDTNRVKEYLEQFDIASFSMVGHISNEEGLWGLIRNQESIYRVKVGDYLGRNHGRITLIDDEEIQLVELMPVGPDLWIERQRRIPLIQPQENE